MKSRVAWVGVGVLGGWLFASGEAGAQAAQPPPPAPSPAAAPAPAGSTATPAAPSSAPPATAIPPGYKLVPIEPPSTGEPPPASTRYDVQYPQRRGALPPGMELPYEAGRPIPPGYRVVKQTRRGLIIAGSIVTGVPWTFSVMGAVGADYDNHSGFLLVPGLGPWLMLAAGGGKDKCNTDYDYRVCENRAGLRAVLVLDGLVQTAGVAMFVAGVAVPKLRLVRNDVTVSMLPTQLGRDGYGLTAIGSF
ncbi:MAG TPA: hypothetical protein VFQ61_15085 [Polyangiaceae bacterium]|nr:hypothetical protein [Polyangiaceae bacterium]